MLWVDLCEFTSTFNLYQFIWIHCKTFSWKVNLCLIGILLMPIYSRTKYRTEKLQLVLGQIFAIDGRKSAKYTKERSRGKIVVLKIGFSFPRRTLISQWCGQKMANSYFLKRKAHKYMPISFPCGRKNSYEVYVRVLNSFVKDVKISLISFIGNTGGLMGLYLGLSFLSIFELLNHFIKCIFEK